MKTLLYILFFSISAISFAQDPQLFENDWYLYEVLSSDAGTHYDVSNINPPITPYLTISEDLNFNGDGACNTFSGTYEFVGDEFYPINFTPTTDDCEVQQHNSFESEYFGFISFGFWHSITQDNEGKVLTLTNAVFGHAIFKSYPLSISDYQKDKFHLYPNPVKKELFLNSKNTVRNIVLKIFNIEGKLLSTQNVVVGNQSSVNVSQLSQGVYFINIQDENGKIEIKKFIKE